MSNRIAPVKIGFYDPHDVYPKIKDQIEENVQLTNLQWRKTPAESLRSIPKLPFQFVEETPRVFDNSEHGSPFRIVDTPNPLAASLKLLKTPYTRVMFFQCENTDIYKSQVRPLIQAWKDQNITKANTDIDWYIVYYVDSQTESKNHHKVFEKVKLDFSEDETIDRVVKLKASFVNSLEKRETWNSFSSKLKSGVLFTFSTKLKLLRDAILSGATNDVLTSIVLREGIAQQFLTLHLFEDALGEYDHLQHLVDQSLDNFKAYDQKLENLEHFVDLPLLLQTPEEELTQFSIKSYIFSKQFIILEALSDHASSISIASLHISEFLKRLESFILEISKTLDSSVIVDEWIYKTINEALQLDVCIKIVATENEDETLNQISERFGELLLLQRSKFLTIGSTLGFTIDGIFTNIPLIKPGELSYKSLIDSLSSTEAFEDQFITLTENAIKHFSVSGRPRAVDTLSIDIALLDYQNKQYGKAALVLANCPDFYGSEGWDFIGHHLLGTYIDCLEHLDDTTQLLEQPKEVLLVSSYILFLSSAKTRHDIPIEQLNETLKKLASLEVNEVVPFPLEKIFDFEIEPYVSTSSGAYQIEIKLRHFSKLTIDTKRITLNLINDENDVLTFTSRDVQITDSTASFILETKDISFGNFKVLKLTADLGPIQLVHDFVENIEVITYPCATSTALTIGNSTKMDLSSKTVSVFIHTKEKLESGSVLITSLDGLDIHRDLIKIEQGDTSIPFNQEDGLINIESLDSGRTYEIITPYTPNPKLNTFRLLVEFKYLVNGVPHSQSVKRTMDNKLSIAVSVQDIYKNNGLYSNFTIGTADISLPIRILNVDLKENNKYNVTTSLKPNELIAFGEQPGNYFFKIDTRDEHSEDSDSLPLDIEFRDLSDELLKIWGELVYQELKKESLESYSPLFSDLKELEFNYQAYVIDSVVSVVKADRFNWKLCSAIPPAHKQKVKEILRRLITSTTPVVPVNFTNSHLFINVAIPLVKVMHTVELLFPKELIYTVLGEEIHTQLSVKSIVNSTIGKEKAQNTNDSKKKVSFINEESNVYELEILNNQDSWLINGKTRFTFNLDSDDSSINEITNHLTLIPMKVGKIVLPRIKISNESFKSKTEYLMEVDYKNENETIYVVSERS